MAGSLSTRSLLLGLDLGGGSIRCLAVDTDTRDTWTAARAIAIDRDTAHGALAYRFRLSGSGSLDDALGAVVRDCLGLASATPGDVAGVACASQRHTTVVVGANGEVLMAAPNRDARAAGEGIRLAIEHGEALNAMGGHWPLPIFLAARLQWMASQQPDLLARARYAFSASDWLAWRMTGVAASDPTQAGESSLFDLESRDWSRDWAARLGIAPELLPPVAEPGTVLGELQPDAAEWLGLLPGTPVGVGAADTQAAALGSNALGVGDTLVLAGTTLPIQRGTLRRNGDPDARCWIGQHALAGMRVVESNQGSVGEPLEWFARLLHPDAPAPVASLLAEARDAEPGAHAALSTLGASIMNAREPILPYANLGFSHMALPSGASGGDAARAALSRSIVEGIACGIRTNLSQLDGLEAPAERGAVLSGGLSRSPSFARILAAMLGGELRVSRIHESSALGAALCAGVGAGRFADFESAAHELVAEPTVTEALPEEIAAAEETFDAWHTQRELRAAADSAGAMRSTGAMLVRSDPAPDAPAAGRTGPVRILATADLDAASLERLRELGDVEYASFREAKRLLTGPALVGALEGVDVFLTEIDVVDVDAIAASKSLRAVITCRGDAVNVDIDACTLHGIPVLNTPGRNADAVADLTLAFILMLARKLDGATSFLRSGEIESGDMGKMGQAFNAFRGRELQGLTVGLIGLGAVGRGVAKRLRGFAARILVADPFLDAETAAAAGAELVTLQELLEESDITSLHAPVTPETRQLIDAAAIAGMKPGSALVNTARAALVDEEALREALVSGRLSGAALDVFSVEPPGADFPLFAAPNVIATPHVAGNSIEIAGHQGRIAADELSVLLGGGHPQYCLNPQVLESLDWNAARVTPSAEELAGLRNRPAPAVTDLDRDSKEKPTPHPAAKAEAAGAEAVVPTEAQAPSTSPELRAEFETVLQSFVDGVAGDAAIAAFAANQDVTLHFRIADAEAEFHVVLRAEVRAALGAPEERAEVALRLSGATLDGMFLGTLNPMEAAMAGDISFTGDTAKAMTLQHLQADFQRIYSASRVGHEALDELTSLLQAPAVSVATDGGSAILDATLRSDICATVDGLYATQVITATGGNVSARPPASGDGGGRIWITPSQLFKGDLGAEALVAIDLEGNPLDDSERSPSSEWAMHTGIYRLRPDIRAVVHAHAPHATILCNSEIPFVPVSTEAAFFGEIARVPFIMPGTHELARAVSEAMGDGNAVLMMNHGLIVGARSLRRAADMIEVIERSAEIILGCHAVGKPPPELPPDVVRELRKLSDLVA